MPETGWGEMSLLSRNFNRMTATIKAFQELQVDRILEEKAQVNALVQTIPEGIVMADYDGRVIYMNLIARVILALNDSFDTSMPLKSVHEVLTEPAIRELALTLIRRKKKATSACATSSSRPTTPSSSAASAS